MKTLGEFYREKILPRNDLVTREIHGSSDEVKAVQDLFGWRLFAGKSPIECRSEEEARYLKILLEAGMTSIDVPEDDEYLRSIIPELEDLKTRIDEILNSYLETILDRKIRQRLKHEVFMELIE